MPTLYRVLKDRFSNSNDDRFKAKVNDVVYLFQGYDYGLASDDTRMTGVVHASVCHPHSKDVFFTIPVEDLEAVARA